jgi:NAD(P)H-flavin reductase
MNKNYITPILNELEEIKYHSRELDKHMLVTGRQTDDLSYVLEKLKEITEFLTAPVDKVA